LNFLNIARSLGFYGAIAYTFILFYGLLVFQVPVDNFNILLFAIAALYVGTRGLYIFRYGLKVSRQEVVGATLLLVCWASVGVNTAFVPEVFDSEGLPAIQQVRNHLVFGTIWMLIGAAASLHQARQSDIVGLLLILALAFAVFMGVRNSDGVFTVLYSNMTVAAETGDEKITHLTFGYSATLIFATAYAFAKNLRPVVFVLGAAALFPLESRSAFFIGMVAILLFEFLSGSRWKIVRTVIPLVFAAIAVLVILQADLIDLDDTRNQRMLMAFGMDEDTSAVGRSEILARSWKGLGDQFLFGDPTFMAREFGDLGAFIHNLLSAWQYYGFPAFLLFVLGLWLSFNNARRADSGWREDAVSSTGFIVLIYIIIGMCLSHFVAHRLLWFALGFWLFNTNHLRTASDRTSDNHVRRGPGFSLDLKGLLGGGGVSKSKRKRRRQSTRK